MGKGQSYLNLIGLATRARKVSLGEEQIVRDIRKKKAKLVLIAKNTGHQTKKKLTDKCNFYEVPFQFIDDRETLSQAIGKEDRVAIAILDQGFANKICSLLDNSIRG